MLKKLWGGQKATDTEEEPRLPEKKIRKQSLEECNEAAEKELAKYSRGQINNYFKKGTYEIIGYKVIPFEVLDKAGEPAEVKIFFV